MSERIDRASRSSIGSLRTETTTTTPGTKISVQNFICLNESGSDCAKVTLDLNITRDLYVANMEILQVVYGGILVSGKTTTLRVYVGVQGTNRHVEHVSGRLIRVGIDDWGTALRSDNSIYVDPAEDPVQDNRDNINGTLNFTLPSDWSTGTYEVEVWINYPPGINECAEARCQNNNRWLARLRFADEANPLRVSMIQVKAAGLEPSRDTLSPTMSKLTQMFPINRVDWWILPTIGGDFDYTTDKGWNVLLDKVEEIAADDDTVFDDMKYYGVIHPDVQTDWIAGLATISGPAAVGYARNPVTMVHEIAHTMGRRHAPGCDTLGVDDSYPNNTGKLDFYGLYPGDEWWPYRPRVFSTNDTYDIMSYCSPKWISSYTYNHVYNDFLSPAAAPAAPTRRKASLAANGTYLRVAGRIFAGAIKDDLLRPFYQVSLPAGSNDQPGSGAFAIELQNSVGQPLFTRYFDPIARSDSASGDGSFQEIVPFVNGTARIVITRPITTTNPIKRVGTELASRTVSAHSPVVTLVSPNGGESWAASGTNTVTWNASDADGDSLTYTLQYSPDAGVTWKALAVSLTTTQYVVDAADLGGSNQMLIRVTATDGVNTSQDTSDRTFSVARKGPEVYVASPENGSVLTPGKLVELDGLATDLEDGPLGNSALVWTSNQQGVLGTGSHLLTNLTSGSHTVTLTATDSDGMKGTASVTIYVGYKLSLPLIVR